MKWEVRTMRSGTSFFDGTVFKKTICRFWPLWGMYFAVWLVALPLNGLILLRLEANARPGLTGGYMENFAYSSVPEAAGAALPIALVFGVLCAMAVFSHLYNARSANLFGSLPIRREGLFLTHYLAGLAFLVVPNAVIFLLCLALETAGGCVVMDGLLFWLAVSCGECFFFYSLAVFCAMFTGHILALPAFYGIINCLAYGVTGLVLTVFQMFYYGFTTFGNGVFEVIKWLTPVERLGERVVSHWAYPSNTTGVGDPFDYSQRILRTCGLGTVGIYAAAALALTAGAFFLYRARNLESAGDVVSVKVMRPVFKYGVAFCVGLALGMGTAFAVGGLEEFGLAAAIVVWGVIGYFAAEMLLQKSFKVFRSWKGAVAVAGAFIALSLVVGFDLTGFETRVPDPANVATVYVGGLDAVRLDDTGDQVRLLVDDPGQIGLLVDLHRAAVEQRDWDDHTGTRSDETRVASVELTYTMKNGSTLIRRYRAVRVEPGQAGQEGTAAWALEQLYADRGLYWRAYEFDELEARIAQPGWRLERAELGSFTYSEENGYWDQGISYFYAPYARTLLDAVEEDFKAGRIGVRTLADADWYPPEEGQTLSFWAQDGDGSRFWMEITVQDGSSSTLRALEELAEYAVTDDIRDEPDHEKFQ